MKKIFLASLAIIVILSGIVVYEVLSPALSEGKDTDCDRGYETTAISAIKSDFTSAKVPRWTFITDKIGTQSPKLKFEALTFQAGSYFVPFTASGSGGSVHLISMMDCKNHKIEYSIVN
jgi:hypothetical protein